MSSSPLLTGHLPQAPRSLTLSHATRVRFASPSRSTYIPSLCDSLQFFLRGDRHHKTLFPADSRLPIKFLLIAIAAAEMLWRLLHLPMNMHDGPKHLQIHPSLALTPIPDARHDDYHDADLQLKAQPPTSNPSRTPKSTIPNPDGCCGYQRLLGLPLHIQSCSPPRSHRRLQLEGRLSNWTTPVR